ncbi:MAG: hypothetical protein VX130_00395 [Verrucomicrobiota bacterium]|nr:hypothetical protein [Verrucomicrobiota bacterium]
MKTITISLVLLLTYSGVQLQASENYGDGLSPYIDSRGNDLFSESKTIKIKDPGSESLLCRSERRKVVLGQFWRKSTLISEANRRLHFDIQSKRAAARRTAQLAHREQVYADAWHASATGQRDGRLWSYLSDSEKEMYRQRYLDFHSGRKGIEKAPEPEPEYDFEIPDLEFAYAWEKSYAGITDGRKWSELDERTEKSSFRKKYLALQVAIHNWESSFGMPQISLDGDSMMASASSK